RGAARRVPPTHHGRRRAARSARVVPCVVAAHAVGWPVMTARDEILGRVRAALADAAEVPAAAVPRRTPDPSADVVALFCERVADYRAVVERCTSRQLRAPIRSAL